VNPDRKDHRHDRQNLFHRVSSSFDDGGSRSPRPPTSPVPDGVEFRRESLREGREVGSFGQGLQHPPAIQASPAYPTPATLGRWRFARRITTSQPALVSLRVH
ncbi:MAG: hypothetical protein K8E66_02410, partial [Phycisphaerales bacterium]|nr:hypothetical protein [Phycisphaerales bacterium]